MQNKTNKERNKQTKTKQNKTKQKKTKENKTKQKKTKQNKQTADLLTEIMQILRKSITSSDDFPVKLKGCIFVEKKLEKKKKKKAKIHDFVSGVYVCFL